MNQLAQLLKTPDSTINQVGSYLDNISETECVAEVRGLNKRQMVKAFDLAATSQPIPLSHFVPTDVAGGQPVTHKGKNSLPIFNIFEKRFCRSEADRELIFGYNEQDMRIVTGPGYFVMRDPKATTEKKTFIDYRSVPKSTIARWPTIQDNNKGLSKFVYGGMQDFMRKVSDRVSVGVAYKNGKNMNAYFMLVRVEPGN